jgi:hypothetical protein
MFDDIENKLEEVIRTHSLLRHEEGGYYKVTFVSDEIVDVPTSKYHGGKRAASSKIDYLLIGHDYSAFHQLRSNEIWKYKDGTSLTLYIIKKSGLLTQVKIGDPVKENDTISEFLVEHDQWFAAAVNNKNSFCFVECEVIPGFDYRDWQLGNKDELIQEYPQHVDIIKTYSRATPGNLIKN